MRRETARGRGLRVLLLGLSLAIAGCGQKQKNITVQQKAGYSDEERQKVTRVIVNDKTVTIQRHDGSVVTIPDVGDKDEVVVEAPGPVEIYENGGMRLVGAPASPGTSPAAPGTPATATGANGTAPPQVVTLPNGQTQVVPGGSTGNGGTATTARTGSPASPSTGSVPFNGTTINVSNPGTGGGGLPNRDTRIGGNQPDGSFQGTFDPTRDATRTVAQGAANSASVSGSGFQPVTYQTDPNSPLTQGQASGSLGVAQQPS